MVDALDIATASRFRVHLCVRKASYCMDSGRTMPSWRVCLIARLPMPSSRACPVSLKRSSVRWSHLRRLQATTKGSTRSIGRCSPMRWVDEPTSNSRKRLACAAVQIMCNDIRIAGIRHFQHLPAGYHASGSRQAIKADRQVRGNGSLPIRANAHTFATDARRGSTGSGIKFVGWNGELLFSPSRQ